MSAPAAQAETGLQFSPSLPWSGTSGGTIILPYAITTADLLNGALEISITAGGEETQLATFNGEQDTYITVNFDNDPIWIIQKWQGSSSEIVLTPRSDDAQQNVFSVTGVELKVVPVADSSRAYPISGTSDACLACLMSDGSKRALTFDGKLVIGVQNQQDSGTYEFSYSPSPLVSTSQEKPSPIPFAFVNLQNVPSDFDLGTEEVEIDYIDYHYDASEGFAAFEVIMKVATVTVNGFQSDGESPFVLITF